MNLASVPNTTSNKSTIPHDEVMRFVGFFIHEAVPNFGNLLVHIHGTRLCNDLQVYGPKTGFVGLCRPVLTAHKRRLRRSLMKLVGVALSGRTTQRWGEAGKIEPLYL